MGVKNGGLCLEKASLILGRERRSFQLKIYGDNLADKIISHVAHIIQQHIRGELWVFVGWGSPFAITHLFILAN